MKLRLKGNEGNSLRLRLSRSEMERLLRGETIAEEVCLGPGEHGSLRYELVGARTSGQLEVLLAPACFRVSVPTARIEIWGAESEVGIYETIAVGGRQLHIVLEKDFACLDKPDAENADTFEHPRTGTAC